MLHRGNAVWGDVYINTVTKKHSTGQLLGQQPRPLRIACRS